MSLFQAKQPVKMTSVEGRVIRKDGTVEELGTLAYWHRNPLRRLAWRVKQLVRGRKAGQITHH
jgi:hypothetical protein